LLFVFLGNFAVAQYQSDDGGYQSRATMAVTRATTVVTNLTTVATSPMTVVTNLTMATRLKKSNQEPPMTKTTSTT
jgi:hypothetical protein